MKPVSVDSESFQQSNEDNSDNLSVVLNYNKKGTLLYVVIWNLT